MTYKVSAGQLEAEAERAARFPESSPEADAMDRVALAVYQVGAALAERLEVLIERLRK